MKAVRFFIAPLLLVALVCTSLYVGLARPGAGKAFASELVSSQEVRDDAASAIVDQLTNSDDVLLTALLTSNRDKAETAISQSLSDSTEQQQIGEAVETVVSAIFTGKPTVEIDSAPIFRPIYLALDAIFPTLKLSRTLGDLDPIVIGKESPLPDLSLLRSILTIGLLLWPLWLLLVGLYIRRNKRAGWRLVAIHTLVIAAVSTLITFSAPMLIQRVVSEPIQKVLVGVAMSKLTFSALWISLALVITSTVVLLLTRERVLPRESATQSQ